MATRLEVTGIAPQGPSRAEWMDAQSGNRYDPGGNLVEFGPPEP